jgi:hypothetical protein
LAVSQHWQTKGGNSNYDNRAGVLNRDIFTGTTAEGGGIEW